MRLLTCPRFGAISATAAMYCLMGGVRVNGVADVVPAVVILRTSELLDDSPFRPLYHQS